MFVDKTCSCFDQYTDNFHKLHKAVFIKYTKLKLSEQEAENTRSVDCSNVRVDRGESKNSEGLQCSDCNKKSIFLFDTHVIIIFHINLDGV